MSSKDVFFISRDDQKKYDEAYVYGTYAPMNWLTDELRKVKLKVVDGIRVAVIGDDLAFEVNSIDEFISWIDKKYPDLSQHLR